MRIAKAVAYSQSRGPHPFSDDRRRPHPGGASFRRASREPGKQGEPPTQVLELGKTLRQACYIASNLGSLSIRG